MRVTRHRIGPFCARCCRSPALVLSAFIIILAVPATATLAQPTIVLIGGKGQGYAPGEHDYASGIRKIERLIDASPEFAKLKPVVKAFPGGFPQDLSEIEDADVVVLYFGMNYSKSGNTTVLAGPAILQHMNELMARGVGLVVLHQSFTVPDDNGDVPLSDWVGGVRVGMADRSTQFAPLTVVAKDHPIARGLASSFHYHDEFYPTIRYKDDPRVTPILSVKVHVQFRNNVAIFEDTPTHAPAAFAYERPNGGRSFAFSGAHYVSALNHPQIRVMLLNAIYWAGKANVPAGGVTIAEEQTAPDKNAPRAAATNVAGAQ